MWEPFGNTTVLPPTQWHPEPQFRGTFSILSSCLITMSLCIWTSLHLNVPEHRKEHLQKYRKAGWMVLGLLAPELVVWNAWEQRKQVKSLNELMRKKGFMPKESTARERISGWFNRTWQNIRAPFSPETEEAQQLEQLVNLTSLGMHNKHMNAWTDVHSWLVVMGGLAFEDKSPEDQQFMPGTRQRVPISLELFEWMVETRPHLIPDISRGYIEDKSKSDWLAKGLTCWQAGYFCIQCTFRLSQQLSIALLELNVFAHAICALLLFLVWWDKPRDIFVPATISSEEALQICAGHLKSARIVVDAQESKYRMLFVPMEDHPPSYECFEIVHPTTMIASGFVRTGLFIFNSNGHYYRFLKFRHTYWKCNISKFSSGPAADHVHNVDIAVELTGRDIAHLVKAHEYFTQSCATYQHASYSETLGAAHLGYRQSNWSLGDGQLFMMVGFENLSDHVRTIAGITFASSCYGGLHLIAWTSEFQSHAAQTWWRAASVTILVTGPFCVAARALAAGFGWVRSRLILSQDKSEDIRLWTLFCFSVSSVLWYILCRTFVVVECFILLAHIPESALRVPTWAAYIPSFG